MFTHRNPGMCHDVTSMSSRDRCDARARTGVARNVSDEDGDLARRAAEGDRHAFRSLVDRHYDACLRFASFRLNDGLDAEDVVQETFVRAYTALPRYRDQDRFKAWLFRILVNRCRTAGRRRRRRRTTSTDELEGSTFLALPADDEATLWRSEIERALDTLPVEQREAFLLKFVEGWSYEEMAAMTGVGLSALKMRVSRARERLTQKLEEVRDDGR